MVVVQNKQSETRERARREEFDIFNLKARKNTKQKQGEKGKE